MEFAISRAKRPSEFNMKASHCHAHYELYYLLSGSCRIFINHTLYCVEPGDMIILKPGEIHRTTYHSGTASERAIVNFGREYLGDMENVCGSEKTEKLFSETKITVPAASRSYVEDLIRRMERESMGQDGYSPLLKKNYLCELLIFLYRSRSTELSGAKPEVEEKAVEEAAEYIYHHFKEPMKLEDVAERVHMSPAYFSRKFKAVTGFGYKEYLTHVRIREASVLLSTTAQSVTDIALGCGFGDGNYFGDAFKKIRGVSPRQYRKNSAMEKLKREG